MSVVSQPVPFPATGTTVGAATARARGRHEGGQSLVEFALILTPLTLVLLGIIQLGLVFNAYVTLANATREGARAGTVYVYDRTLTKAQNDSARSAVVMAAVRDAMGFLPRNSPHLVDSEIVIRYVVPSGARDVDSRAGQQMSVRTTYRLDLLIPLIAQLLPRDAAGRMPLDAQVTMVVN